MPLQLELLVKGGGRQRMKQDEFDESLIGTVWR